MDLEPKIQNPLTLKLSHHGCDILSDDKYRKDLPLKIGALIGSEHYGFTLIVDCGDKQSETTYPTQCRISGAELKNGMLIVYEDNKYTPWRFDENGTFKNEAVFIYGIHRDCDFLAQEFGITGQEQVEEVNAYRKR